MRYDAGEIITAMVTPFKENYEVDYEALEKLVNHLIDNGSDAILVAGTTGECPTLTHEEEWDILKFVIKVVNGRVKVVMGTGSNSTQTAIMTAKKAEELGADAILTVVPYYNKPNQRGMIAHFSAVAEAVKLPIILYNIPGRTGVNMLPATVAELAKKYSHIVAVKQSNSDLDLISEMQEVCPADFAIYSGDDSLTLPMLSLGAHGVISVASHVVGTDMKKMITEFKAGNNKAALEIHKKLFPIFKKLFMCPSPSPVKDLLAAKGIIKNVLRLPLVNMTDKEKEEFYTVAKQYA
ncbi:MAG: 4-hydroxy-tetrahydrodipicolinate synthase [Candidatus Gastranaerophilales bacterium]|nr:4-hydroxy-tetrahydrodipicolinate synthase [Candidatus Gastranaerophilales bacterium]